MLTAQQTQSETDEPEEVATKPEPEPEPKADTPGAVDAPDAAQPAGSSESKTTESSIEPESKPAGESEVLPSTTTDSAVQSAIRADGTAKSPAVLSTEPAPEQAGAGAKTEADAADFQPCSAQVRQRSWKKRFLGLRYPVLFGRGM
jgi:hypothetical protein